MLDYILIYSMKTDGACPPIEQEVIQALCLNPNKNALVDYSESCFFLNEAKNRLGVFYSEESLTQHLEWLDDRKIHFFDGVVLQGDAVCTAINEFSVPLNTKGPGNYCYGVFSEDCQDMVTGAILGTYPTFWGTIGNLFIISTNPHLILDIFRSFGPIEYSLDAASWFLFHGYFGTLETLYKNIFFLPNNTILKISEDNIPSFHPLITDLYDVRDADSCDKLFNEAYEQFVNHVYIWGKKAIRDDGHELTGGIDSRTILAAAIAAGVHQNVRFRVAGPEGHPDKIVAKLLATKFSLDLEEVPIELREAPEEKWDDIVALARKKLFCVAGLRNLGSMQAPLASRKTGCFRFKGIGGEFFRGYKYSTYLLKKIGKNEPSFALSSEFLHKNALGFKSAADIRYHEKIAYLQRELASLSMVNDTFALDHFECLANMSQFHGGLYFKFGGIECFPSYNTLLHQYAFVTKPEMRAVSHVNFKIMEKACPELLFVPFAEKCWHPLNYEGRKDESVFRQIVPVMNDTQERGLVIKAKNILNAFREILQSPPSLFWEILDKTVYYNALTRVFKEKETISLLPYHHLNLAGVAICLSEGMQNVFNTNGCIPSDITTLPLHRKARRLVQSTTESKGYDLHFMLTVKPLSLLRR
ncbi:hypothetical protein LJC46_01950 [Desulfovibrio sp. OttesenSCG-928-G15]|nr:hypothetical protein [Desulfovibrio sp. OttesenSCG-928-G15]